MSKPVKPFPADGHENPRPSLDLAAADCLAEGSLIATPAGERAVETLAIGDLVETAGGVARAVRWIGRRRMTGLNEHEDRRAIVLEAGSLSDFSPSRMLAVSADHAILIDGMLIPAGLLINDGTIRRSEETTPLQLFAIEFDSHDILVVDGTTVESYVDCDNRHRFDNAAEHVVLYPADDTPTWTFCAPRVSSGPRFDAVAQRLARRAETLALTSESGTSVVGFLDIADRLGVSGWAFDTADPDGHVRLEVVVDEVVLATIVAAGPREDVRLAGYGSGLAGYAFTFSPPLSHFQRHEIDVRVARNLAGLAGSPRTIDASMSLDDATLAEFTRAVEATAAISGDTDHALRMLAVAVERLRAASARGDPDIDRTVSAAPLLLMIDDTIPDPGQDAGSQAIVSHATSLARLGLRVLFIPADRSDTPCPALEAAGVQVARRADFRSVEDVLKHHGTDARFVYIHRLSNVTRYGALVRVHCPAVRLLYCVADLHFLRQGRQAELLGDPELREDSRRTADREIACCAAADYVLTHSTHEASLLRSLLPFGDIRVVPWEITGQPDPRPFDARNGIAFIGGARHKPNLDAACVIVTELVPRLREAGFTGPVTLVGQGLDAACADMEMDPEIRVLGHVASLADILGEVRLTIAPIRFGAGVKGKVVQSYAFGVPCVASALGAEGLDLPAALSEATVAADIEAMVAAIVRVHGEVAAHEAASAASLAYARSQWSADAVDQSLAAIVGRHVRQGRSQAA